MKAEILKIAGCKTQKEFYKKYPSEEAFMKVHGKAFKKAQMGTLIGGGSPKQFNSSQQEYVDFQKVYDNNNKLITGSTEAEKQKAAYEKAMLEAKSEKSEGGGGGMGGMMSSIGGIMSMFGGSGGGASGSAKRYGGDIPMAYSGFTTPNWFNNATTTPQTTYPSNITQSSYGIGSQTMGKMGGAAPVNQPGPQQSYGPGGTNYTGPGAQIAPTDTSNPNWMNKNTSGAPYANSNMNQYVGNQQPVDSNKPSAGAKTMKKIDPLGISGNLAEGYDKLRAERRARKRAQQQYEISDVTRRASATKEEESKRRYVRPEDIQNTGEEFFPIYGVGTNILTRNGGQFHKAQNGGYIGGNPTEIQNTYSNGYDIYTHGGYEPLQDPHQLKDFRYGGDIERAQSGWSNWMNSMNGGGSGFSGASSAGGSGASSGGGGMSGNMYGQIGSTVTGAGQNLTGGQNAGGQIGGTIGKSVGSIWGPIGGAIGEVVGGIGGNLLDNNPKRIKKYNEKTKNNITAMTLNSGFQSLNSQNNRYVRNGGDIDSYEDGGYLNPEYNPQVITMFGDHNSKDFADYAHKYRSGGHLKEYTEPSERAMETYAMGGQLQTHWGGKAETISHNPYMPGSGETVMFRGQSHDESDKEGNTGIGITYGENPVEVERGEPMFEMGSGGEIDPQTGEAETTGVVFGNMQLDKKIVGQFNDPDLMAIADKYHGKKFKNIGLDLAKQEAKQNKIIDKNTSILDSFKIETSLDKVKAAGIKANMEGADAKLRNIANTKITLANYQNAINDAKEELSNVVGENLSAEDLARGYAKLDKDPVTMDSNRWGGNIAKKAKDGVTIDPGKITKAELAAYIAKGYKQDPKNPNRYYLPGTSKEVVTKIPGSEAEIKKGTGPIKDNYKGPKMSNADWTEFLKTKQGQAYKQKFITGTSDEVIKPAVAPSEKKEMVTTPEDEVIVKEETPTPEEKAKFPWLALANQAINYFRPSDQEGMDYEQLYPEMYAMASNQLEPVPAQSYQPELIVPYDISLQAQRNAVMSRDRALEKQLGYNPAAQANAAPASYNAINEINEKEFIANQGLKNQVYTGNVNTMNEANKINLGIFADQWAKQSQARSNTKATTQAALNSIADKYAKHKLENRKLSIYENMYNYRFGKSGKAQNYNPLQIFDTTVSGSKEKGDQELPGYKAMSYDKDGNVLTWKKITDKDVQDDMEAVGGIGEKEKNGGYTKIKSKNGSILRAFKNL